MSPRAVFEALGRWPIALATCGVLALLVLMPCIGSTGLWDPHERALSDRVAPPGSVADPAPAKRPPRTDGDCDRVAPEDHVARSLTSRSIRFGRDYVSDSDFGRRFPLAVLGLLTVIALAGAAIRGGGARAGVVATAVVLAMPLCTLQARMLTSDIGTACGATLIVSGLFGLMYPSRRWLGLDLALSSLALLAGLAAGFVGGGALHGLVVPIGAVAAAGGLGVPFVAAAMRKRPLQVPIVGLVATLVVATLIGLLTYELYQLVTPYPGLTPPPARQMFGKAIVAEGCWSDLLGAVWRPEDDLRFAFDSTFEQIAYGTYPWGILAPIAMFALLRSDDPKKRMVGAITLAWAGGAWIACEAFQRKSGFVLWSAFPALALAIGVWVEDVIDRRARGQTDLLPSAAAMLIALFVALAVIDFGKDLQSFTDKLTSLLGGTETVTYPKDAKLIVPVKWWVLLLGGLGALGFALGLALWRTAADPFSRSLRRASAIAMAVALAATVATALFWTFGWQPRLSQYLSSKPMIERYNELRDPARPEPLFIMGDLGHAPAFYTDVTPTKLASREQVVAQLKQKPQRVFAIAPQAELCTLHREMGDVPYFVVYGKNLRSLLFSNSDAGAEDENPLRDMIVHKPPSQMQGKPKGRVVWDNKIELIGWDIPAKVSAGESIEVVTYYKILSPVGGAWTMLVHIDGAVRLRDGDHKPIKDRCPTSTWMPGDYIIDRHTMPTTGNPSGRYDVWLGFFTGSAPNFRNMDVSLAPADMIDANDRVKITSIIID